MENSTPDARPAAPQTCSLTGWIDSRGSGTNECSVWACTNLSGEMMSSMSSFSIAILLAASPAWAQQAAVGEECKIRRGTLCADMKLVGADLGGADLANSQFSGSDLSEANLKAANLKEANLARVMLRKA